MTIEFEAIWTRVEIQLRFLQKIAPLLGHDFAESHLKLLQKLEDKLMQIAARLPSTEARCPSHIGKISEMARKLKFSLTKDRLKDLTHGLRTWSELFDPSWYLITLISDKVLDSALLESQKPQGTLSTSSNPSTPLDNMLALRLAIQNTDGGGSTPKPSVTLNPANLSNAQKFAIPFCTAKAFIRFNSTTMLIIEPIDLSVGSVVQIKHDAENLARRLQQVDPGVFGILKCYGLLKHRCESTKNLASIEMVYRVPDIMKPPTTLRHLLLEQTPVSTTIIVRTAKQLLKSVHYIHTCAFVHKNIKPDNILVFPSDSSVLGSSFLVGFNQFRNANFQTYLSGDSAWHRNLYRHPDRQGPVLQERYIMQHDLYSIGVCLLELGLWRSFVFYPDGDCSKTPLPTLSLQVEFSQNQPYQIKNHLLLLAKQELPPRLGDIYTSIVIKCLTCLDPGSEFVENQEAMRDSDGIILGVRFVETILTKISEISI